MRSAPRQRGPWPLKGSLRSAPESAIRATDENHLRRSTIRLGLGEPTWFGEAEGLPEPALEALRTIRSAPYGQRSGEITLRQAVADYEGVHEDEVLITSGAQGALFALACACLGPGDVALVPDPGFPAYASLARMVGAEVRTYALTAERFRLDASEIEAALAAEPRIKALFLNHPGNPTGGGGDSSELCRITEACERYGVQVVSDEVYRELYLDAPMPGLRQVSSGGVVVGSVSKGWGAPGLRVGWLVGDPTWLEVCRGWHGWAVTSASTPSQWVAKALLDHREVILQTSRRELRRRWRILSTVWRAELGILPTPPDGGLYHWFRLPQGISSSSDFCRRLAESEGVMLVPGHAFGRRGEGWVRLSFGGGIESLKEGVARVAGYLRRSGTTASPVTARGGVA